MSLDKLLSLAGPAGQPPDLDDELLLAAQEASRELSVLLASSDDDGDEPDDDDKDGSGDHSGHATYKALVKRNIPPKRAAAMCARSDKNVKATQLARALEVILSGRAGRDISLVTLTPASETAEGRRKAAKAGHALPDGSYPIEDKKHLHSAAVLAASGHGNVSAARALIRRRARELGVDVNTLPGFGSDKEEDGEKAAASMIALAAKVVGDGGVAMNHAPYTGTHQHTHFQSGAHSHPHTHNNDSSHDGGPAHRPGSVPKRMW